MAKASTQNMKYAKRSNNKDICQNGASAVHIAHTLRAHEYTNKNPKTFGLGMKTHIEWKTYSDSYKIGSNQITHSIGGQIIQSNPVIWREVLGVLSWPGHCVFGTN